MTAARPWRWIPSLYFGQGIPYVVVMMLSVVMYKNFGVSNTEIALYTSWLYLPWVIKPLWSPLVELLGTRRRWVVGLQFGIGAALAAVALTLQAPMWFQLSLMMFWLMAFASATHDIAADGFYMLALPQRTQAAFVGVRSTFYRLAMIAGQGGLVVLAGLLIERTGSVSTAWMVVLALLAAGFGLLGAWHLSVLPRPVADVPAPRPAQGLAGFARDFAAVFAAFFRQPAVWRVLLFLLLYRFAEAQLVKLIAPFLLDPVEAGGLGLRNQDLGLAYGSFGVAALTCGGLLGGWLIARFSLKTMLWPLVLAMHLPNTVFVALAAWQPAGLGWVTGAIVVEQFGYGLGFTAYLVYMLMVAQGGAAGANPHQETPGRPKFPDAPSGGRDGLARPLGAHQTAHYALCTGFMALGMMLPGMGAGWLQEQLGYLNFFIWCCVATLPSFLAAALIRIDPGFGRKEPGQG